MNHSATVAIESASQQIKARDFINCVAGAIKDAAENMPDFTANQASIAKSVAIMFCGGGAVAIVGMITRAKYSLKASKSEGVILSPGNVQAA